MSFLFQDNVIFERLHETSQYKEITVAHLEQFATEGKTQEWEGAVWGSSVDFFLNQLIFFNIFCLAFNLFYEHG